MSNKALKPLLMHGALLAVGLIAGTFGSQFSAPNDAALQRSIVERPATIQSPFELRANHERVNATKEHKS